MSAIEEFLNSYNREYEHYFEVARMCDIMCEMFLSQSGIRGIVSSRAKKPDRLRDKIEKRHKYKKYKTTEDISLDIVDLAGTRIAVYFPGDISKVAKFIESSFEVVNVKEFPQASTPRHAYKKRFAGYSAIHYHVKFRPDRLPEEKLHYANSLIEIQIATVLMHAWAEVEHDLIYKPSTGEISQDEYAILDELNGLVLSGEIALERLQNAVKQRIAEAGKKFHNHYELAAFLFKSVQLSRPDLIEEPIMGRVDMLLHFLRMTKLDTPESLTPYITIFDVHNEQESITEQIIDRILSENPEFYCIYADTQKEVKTLSPYRTCDELPSFPIGEGAIEFFISRWIKFESIFRDVYRKLVTMDDPTEFVYPSMENLDKINMFDNDVIFELESIKKLRNELVHGILTPSNDTLIQAGNVLEKITLEMIEKSDGPTRRQLHII